MARTNYNRVGLGGEDPEDYGEPFAPPGGEWPGQGGEYNVEAIPMPIEFPEEPTVPDVGGGGGADDIDRKSVV